jgi:hypothetical protein
MDIAGLIYAAPEGRALGALEERTFRRSHWAIVNHPAHIAHQATSHQPEGRSSGSAPVILAAAASNSLAVARIMSTRHGSSD